MKNESFIPILLSLILIGGKVSVFPETVPWAVVGVPVIAYYLTDILIWLFAAIVSVLYLSVLGIFFVGAGIVFCCVGAWVLVSEGVSKLTTNKA